jgi:hypothetical protein
MGTRFRRTMKIGGVRINVGKHGFSTSVGPRGSSITIGKRGVYSNIGIPGTGISYRSKLGGTGSFQRSNSPATPTAGARSQTVSLNFILDDETGETRWTDASGQPISDEYIKIAKKQNREIIVTMLESGSEKINNKIDSLLKIYLSTPSPDTIISYTPLPYSEVMPSPPDKSSYVAKKPTEPDLKKQNFLSQRVSFLSKSIEQSNEKMIAEYQIELAKAEQKQIELTNKLSVDYKIYQEKLSHWQEEKDIFEQEQLRLKNYVDVERISNPEAMQDFLEEHLDSLEWPLETNISFEVDNGGTQVWVDIDLPEIEMMPIKIAKVNHSKLNLTITDLSKTQQLRNYLTHIHAIAFRIAGEVFVALPTIHEVILSGYSQRLNRRTGQVGNEYLYSIKVQRNIWENINFARLESLDVVDCFEMFDIRRTISKAGIISPIEPFTL